MNKGKFFAASVAAVVLLCSQALAVSWPPQENEASLWKTHTDSALGLDISSFHYEEPGLMKLDGTLGGFHYDAVHYKPLYFDFFTRLMFGSLDYDGHLQDGTPYAMETDDLLAELRGSVGYDFLQEDRNAAIALYGGFGYRYWFNDSSSDPAGYLREISYYYLPLGIDLSKRFENRTTLRIRAEYDYFLHGKVTTNLSDLGPGYSDAENEQDSGYGARFSVALELPVGQTGKFALEPYWHYWDIDQSDYDYQNGYRVWEPANTTTEYGLSISYVW